MSTTLGTCIDSEDIERFRTAIARRFGLHFDDGKLGFLAEVLERRLRAVADTAEPYLRRLEAERQRSELGALAHELTVAETFFFRNRAQFQAFADVVVRDRLAARAPARELHVLSAGCASGEEAYSLAISLLECGIAIGRDVTIRAVDLDPSNLEHAARGRYSAWSLRETPPEARQRWFRRHDRELELDPNVRNAVRFEERNLAEDHPDLWRPNFYDVVFCRNLIMYFTPECAQALVARITRSLAPGGYLFLGHAETLRGVSSDHHLHHSHGTFYYQRKSAPEEPPAIPRAKPLACNRPVDAEWTSTWMGTVSRATDRIRVLSAATAMPSDESSSRIASLPRDPARVARALELLKGERFDDALHELSTRATQERRDPDVLLLRAALLTHSGKLTEAEQVCCELLQADELNAAAHYLLALCRAGTGCTQEAAHHHEVAAYLDRAFAMPRLHLGLIARRAGNHTLARRELGQALLLLQREDASRVLLFGGGFGRDALLALCRSELEASEGRP